MNQPITHRIESIDFVRGLVMVIMALDHTRDLFHVTSLSQSPTDLATTTPFLFFTRWITHLCAPTFVFLSGVSAYLSFHQKNEISKSRTFLITRGLWLIFLELTLINFGVWFDVNFSIIMLQVIFAIGCGFIVLGIFLHFRPAIHLMTGLLIIFLHNLYPFALPDNTLVLKQMLDPLFNPGFYALHDTTNLLLAYPPVPWTGILLTGFGLGSYLHTSMQQRKNLFLILSAGAVVSSLLLRFLNYYGDPNPWSSQEDPVFTVLSFFNTTKYPPSLLYTLLMLGIMFFLLYLAEGKETRFIRRIKVYGKVPLFYYLLHWYVLHTLLFILIFSKGYSFDQFVFGFSFGRPEAFEGFSLVGVYLVWILVVALFYPLCKWYSRYKQEHKDLQWLRYL